MFLVSDKTENREKRIRNFLTKDDCAIAVLLAAAHFEWSVSRAILALGTKPNKELRTILVNCYGIDKYKDLWAQEVVPGRKIGRLPVVIKEWATFKKAFNLRHSLIHGRDSCSLAYAEPRVISILQASCDVHHACAVEGIDLHVRLKVRRKPREK